MAVNDLDLDQIITTIAAEQGSGGPLDRVTAAREVGARLEAFAHHVVAHFVDEARREGASWTDIGTALGVTRQAAQQRFVPAEGLDVETAASKGLLPLSSRASSALRAGRELAAEHHHATVEDIHLLLALLASRSSGAVNALKELGRRVADVRKAARAQLPADGPRRSVKTPPLGRSGVKVLDVATREALRANSEQVGTEHLLLALASVPTSAAGRALAEVEVDYDSIRAQVVGAKAPTTAASKRRRKRA
ncbi:Clp protease N-terminal domain-containing protein [Thermasporomyces composti]|jgi:hypothetical protein|uniref:ClpA/ClpB-like protein n=1 Tax=Thermasporomyces composti TaxID=696763 RepID=A0A3D9V6K1_THECX|nr:Clp protease N-terminal domain-containing protein [Thermasporomyces composti]REF34655.1 ClpA/ClpB-like protein [Thermasporomyces composti]